MLQQWGAALWGLIVSGWPAIMTVVLPFIVNLIAKCDWSGAAKSALAFGLSALVGVVGAFVAGVPLEPSTLGTFALLVFGGCTVAYQVFRRFEITNRWLDVLLAFGSAMGSDAK